MGTLVLLVIGYLIWQFINSDTSSAQNAKDQDFEDMNLSLKDDDDDFGIF